MIWVKSPNMDDQKIKNRIVEKMIIDGPITGSNKITIDSAIDKYLQSHEQGRDKTLIDEMLKDPNSPIEGYGGRARANVRLTSVEAAVQYLKDSDGNVPFGYD